MSDGKQKERSWLDLELEDDHDEEFEQEVDDRRLPPELRELLAGHKRSSIDRQVYFRELLRLQNELIKLQDWVAHAGLKLVVLFEGRDSAGKGGVIKRITQRINPRTCRVVALPAPWIARRSSGTSSDMSRISRPRARSSIRPQLVQSRRCRTRDGLCLRAAGRGFLQRRAEFERMLVRSGIILVKYWFSITDQEQTAALPDAYP